MTKLSARALVDSGKHLPKFLRDFHDAKRCFRRLQELVDNRRKARENNPRRHLADSLPDWVCAQMYVIDVFLWYMAKCGYTLQPDIKRKGQVDYAADLEAFEKRYFRNLP